MAQWSGQFSGLTHDTKVRDAEESLRLANAALVDVQSADRDRKIRAVRALAERVLTARLKAIGAKIAALTEPGRHDDARVSGLQEREQQLRGDGVAGILREFGARDTL